MSLEGDENNDNNQLNNQVTRTAKKTTTSKTTAVNVKIANTINPTFKVWLHARGVKHRRLGRRSQTLKNNTLRGAKCRMGG
ncbi:MAG: hypothetical protein QXL91_01400 [Candidatus Bathyarchaeia archaeon]|nr:hypothetical protein [Candidatus Bathyarchaeota archaeon]